MHALRRASARPAAAAATTASVRPGAAGPTSVSAHCARATPATNPLRTRAQVDARRAFSTLRQNTLLRKDVAAEVRAATAPSSSSSLQLPRTFSLSAGSAAAAASIRTTHAHFSSFTAASSTANSASSSASSRSAPFFTAASSSSAFSSSARASVAATSLSRALFASAHAVRAFHARTAAFNANNSNNSSTASFSTVVAAEPGQQQQEQQQQQQDDGSNNKSSGGQSSSSSSSSSSTSFNPFSWFWLQCRLAFDWYARMLDLYPVRTQSLTSGSLFLVGDLTAQRYERGLDASKGIDVSDRPHIDWLRLAACTSFGLFVLGPCGNFWYSWLDRFTNRLAKPLSWKNVGVKVLLDTAIFNPIFLVVFFTTVSLLEGLTINDIGRKLYRDFVPSYAVDCSIWPPIQTINFRLVPVKFQLLVVNLGCYFDDVFLSYVQHNGMPAIFQRVERWWLEYIGDDGLAHGHGHGHGHKAVKPAAEEGAQVGEAESAVPLVEVLPHPPSSSADAATVVLVPSSEAHPHHAHVHPPRRRADPSEAPLAPQPHHHVVPRVLAEDQVVWRLPRARGVDVQLVEELDADWTDVPASEEDKKRAGIAAANKKKTQQPQTPPKRD